MSVRFQTSLPPGTRALRVHREGSLVYNDTVLLSGLLQTRNVVADIPLDILQFPVPSRTNTSSAACITANSISPLRTLFPGWPCLGRPLQR